MHRSIRSSEAHTFSLHFLHLFAEQIGTANYMAPEIWKRQCQTFKADIFSLGVTLYDLCMLRSLFIGASEVEVQRRIEGWTAADAAAAASQLLPQYSLELAGLLEAMLQVGRVTVGNVRAGGNSWSQQRLESWPSNNHQPGLAGRMHGAHGLLALQAEHVALCPPIYCNAA